MKEKFQILICFSKKQNQTVGLFTGETLKSPVSFNPQTILSDILANSELPFGIDMKLSKTSKEQYVNTLSGIKRLILESYSNKTTLDMTQIELMRPYYELSYSFEPTALKDNTHCKLFYGSFSLDELLERNLSMYTSYFYRCYSISDAVFSILHFLSLNKFKFSICSHCERFFATLSYKELYCQRYSLYPKYEDKPCAMAVKEIRYDLQRKHRRIYHRLRESHSIKVFNDFEQKFSSSYAEVKECSNIENIDKCYRVVNEGLSIKKKSIRSYGKVMK